MFSPIIIIIFIVLIGLYLSMIMPRLSRKGQILVYRGTMFAHRGYHCKEKGIPENSMTAFEAAIHKGYGIELDVHITKDQRVIVFHDDTLKRVCGVNGQPEQLTLHELKKCSLLGTKERIPTFEEALRLINGQVPLLIELKLPNRSTELCARTYEILKNYKGSYLVQSFNTEGLRWFRTHAPHILRGQLSSNHTKYDFEPHYILRLLTKHLMLNFWGKPDFISYKFADLHTPNTWFLKNILKVPFAVWTLRNEDDLRQGIRYFDMQIFEKSYENY